MMNETAVWINASIRNIVLHGMRLIQPGCTIVNANNRIVGKLYASSRRNTFRTRRTSERIRCNGEFILPRLRAGRMVKPQKQRTNEPGQVVLA